MLIRNLWRWIWYFVETVKILCSQSNDDSCLMRQPVTQGKWSWPTAWSWGSGDHRARMRREGSTAGKRAAESRAGSLRLRWGAAAAFTAVMVAGTSGQPRGYRPFTRIRTGKGTSLLEAERPCYCLYSLVAPGARCGEMPQRHYFQNISRGCQ